MSNLIHVSEAASLALHTMALLAADPERKVSTHEVALAIGASEAHLAKVMQRLGKAGLVKSQRGPKGGFTLDKNPEDVTLLEVYQAAEGPLEELGCLLGTPVCGGNCIMGDLLARVSREIAEYFANTRLSDLPAAWGKECTQCGQCAT